MFSPLSGNFTFFTQERLLAMAHSSQSYVIAWCCNPINITVCCTIALASYLLYRFMTCFPYPGEPFPKFPEIELVMGHYSSKSVTEYDFFREINTKEMDWPAGYFRLLFVKMLAVLDLHCLKEVFVTHGAASSGRVKGEMFHGDKYGDDALVFASGEPWKRNRRIFVEHMRQRGREKHFELMQEEVVFLLEALEKRADRVEPNYLLKRQATNVIATIIFGSRCTDEEAKEFIDCLAEFNSHVDMLPLWFFKFLTYVPIVPAVRRRYKGMRKMKSMIRARMQPLLESGPRNPPQTLVEAYALDSVTGLDENHVVAIMHELFFAGVETIADTMRWFFACMATHPEVQQRLFEEVHSVLGDGGRLQMSQLGVKSLNYLQAVQYEVQRFGSTAQIMPPHQMLETVTLSSGRTIPKGDLVLGTISWPMRQPHLWKYPEQFNPENFLDDQGQFVSNEAFMPYGVGPRICLGYSLADMHMKLLMVEVVRKFRITGCRKIDLSLRVQNTTCSPVPHKYRLIPR